MTENQDRGFEELNDYFQSDLPEDSSVFDDQEDASAGWAVPGGEGADPETWRPDAYEPEGEDDYDEDLPFRAFLAEHFHESEVPSEPVPEMEDISSGRHPEDEIPNPDATKVLSGEDIDFHLDAIDFEEQERAYQPGSAEEIETKRKIKKARREARRDARYRRKVQARNKTRWIRALAGVLSAVAISLVLAWVIMMGVRDIIGIEEAEYLTAEITIEEGMNANDIADTLGEMDVISYPWLFKLLIRLEGVGDTFKPGVHELTPHEAYADIVQELQTVPARTDVVNVMFPEGFNFVEMARRLEENGVCPADEFIEAANSSRYEYPFIKDVGKSSLKFYKMEGYLFPDSYQFFENDKPENAAKVFFDNFQKKIDKYADAIEESGMTMEEVISLASLIQSEAASVDEMRKISSVFHNRLDNPDTYPHLQSDPTYKYVDEVIKPNIKRDNQKMYDAYDTRVCDGLPIGPICNPGEDAIKAALDPESTNYFFFVHNTETGECFFAETYAEHQENCRRLGITGA